MSHPHISTGARTVDHHYDVVISGTGPAGSSAGIRLAKSGLKVLLVEKKVFPRPKVCGGLITEKAVKLLRRDLDLDVSGLILSTASGMELFRENKLLNRTVSDRSVHTVAREDFDHFLQKAALAAGCEILENASIGALGEHSCGIGADRYHFRHLIGADGIQSNVRGKLGIELQRRKMAFGLEVHLPRAEYGARVWPDLPQLFFGYVRHGYGWVFPAGDSLTIGMGGVERGKLEVKNAFEALIGDLGLEEAVRGRKVVGSFLPWGDYLKKPGKGDVLLCGDAAGFAEPVSGEGIFYGIQSGILAADAIVGNAKGALRAYTSSCRKHIFSIFDQALFYRIFLFSSFLQPLSLRKLEGNKKMLDFYMELLSGDLDYHGYLRKLLRNKFRRKR